MKIQDIPSRVKMQGSVTSKSFQTVIAPVPTQTKSAAPLSKPTPAPKK